MKRSPMPPRTARLAPGAPPARRTRMKARNEKRRQTEFQRCYGSKARVKWVNSLPCVACGVEGYSENAHIVGGGMGRKAGYELVVPLCATRYHNRRPVAGCHRILHLVGTHTFQSVHGVDLAAVAARVAQAWEGTR